MKKYFKAILVLILLLLFFHMVSFAQKSSVSFLSNIDNSISPGEDFYQYANGAWLKNNPIPDEYSRWMYFTILDLQVTERLHKLMQEASNAGKAVI